MLGRLAPLCFLGLLASVAGQEYFPELHLDSEHGAIRFGNSAVLSVKCESDEETNVTLVSRLATALDAQSSMLARTNDTVSWQAERLVRLEATVNTQAAMLAAQASLIEAQASMLGSLQATVANLTTTVEANSASLEKLAANPPLAVPKLPRWIEAQACTTVQSGGRNHCPGGACRWCTGYKTTCTFTGTRELVWQRTPSRRAHAHPCDHSSPCVCPAHANIPARILCHSRTPLLHTGPYQRDSDRAACEHRAHCGVPLLEWRGLQSRQLLDRKTQHRWRDGAE